MPLSSISERKSELRNYYRNIREEFSEEYKKSLDNQLALKFLSLEEYKSCKTLFVFVSSPIEINTEKIIQTAFSDKKQVAVPKCRDNSGLMDFYYINSTDCLKKGAFSILEPDPQKCEIVSDLSDGLCIVPGLCYDLQGCRIGFGKGYYDRFLQNFKGTTVGICYSRCVENELPKAPFDKSVDILITEKYINYT